MSGTVTIKEAAKRIRKLAQVYGDSAVFTPAAVVFAEGARRRIIRGIGPDGTPHPLRSPLTASIAGGPKPGRDTGAMVRSIHGFATTGGWGKTKGQAWMIWGSPLAYALTYDRGATIEPRPPRRFLTVPMTREATRYSAREFPRPLHLFPLGRGERPRSLVEFTRQGVMPVYALLKKSIIPKRPFLAPDKHDISAFWRYVKTVSRETLEGRRG